METPLDVLSRAATLVETDPKEGDVSFSMGGRSESPKELPSRVNRQRRSAERREGPLVMKCDGDHTHKPTSAAETSTRCASTQTLITSEMVGIPEINPDLPIPSSSSLMSDEAPSSARLEGRHHGPMPPLHHPHAHAHRHPSLPQQILRPSVITCAPAPLMREPPSNRTEMGGIGMGPYPLSGPFMNGRISGQDRWSVGAKPHQAVTSKNSAEVDPDIEEHFRRSLGRNYQENFSSPPPSSASPPRSMSTSPTTGRASSSPPSSTTATLNSNEVVSITGSVDDHFAKALGEKWSQIKDVIEPGAGDRSSPSTSPSLSISSPVIQQQQASVAS